MSYKLGMISLFVRDVPKAKAFYADFLGMKAIAEFSNASFVFLRPGAGTSIALQDVAAAPPGMVQQSGGFELNLEVEDIDAAWHEWKAKGVEGMSEVTDMGAGRAFRARDPEGNSLTVFHLYDEINAMSQRDGM